MAFDVTKIEERIDRAVIAGTEVSTDIGGIKFQNFGEVMEFAKAMSTSQEAVPKHLRGNPGACLAICVQAQEWRMSPFAVANKSYIASDRMAYESQLIHGVIESRAPLKGRLRHEIVGTGDQRRCRVWGTFRGEATPHEYVGVTLAERIKSIGRNEYGKIKGSPLWDAKPELQLYYDATRDWARMHCPDVILGIYAADELPDADPKDVTPSKREALVARLQDRKQRHKDSRGFDPSHVDRETGHGVIEHQEKENGTKNEPNTAAGHSAGGEADTGSAGNHAGGDVEHNRTGGGADSEIGQDGGTAADNGEAQTPDGERDDTFPPDRKGKKK